MGGHELEAGIPAEQQQEKMNEKEEDPWALPEFQDNGVQWKDLSTRQKLIKICVSIAKALGLLILLYTFIVSLDFLSNAFRLVGGKQAGRVMGETTLLQNPVVGLMLGVLATVLVQSSSTSTSIVITMVGSGLLQVRHAIPIIMGANIGTSVTNTLVSLSQVSNRGEFRRAFAAATVHDMFNWLTVIVLLPLESFTGYLEKMTDAIMDSGNWQQSKGANKAFLTLITKPFTSLIIQLDKKVLTGLAVNNSAYANSSLLKKCCPKGVCQKCGYLFEYFGLSDTVSGIILLIISLVLLCICLVLIVKLLHSILQGKIAVILRKMVNAEPRSPFNHLIGYAAILVGCGVTILVQSSSVFTSALTPLAGVGVITIERMYPLTLGSNLGTTTTGLLAALAADPARLRYTLQIAFCHLFFNLTGILLFYPIPFMRFPLPMAKKLGSITVKYRWFAIFYLLFMFVIAPLTVFGLSLAGFLAFSIVGGSFVVILVAIGVINFLQHRKPSFLPVFLRSWKWLPKPLRSLEPLDRCLFSKCSCIRKTVEESDPKVNILQSPPSVIGLDNEAFAWKLKAENTRL